MKLHVSACNGHRQVSTTIKKSLYIWVSNPYIRLNDRKLTIKIFVFLSLLKEKLYYQVMLSLRLSEHKARRKYEQFLLYAHIVYKRGIHQ